MLLTGKSAVVTRKWVRIVNIALTHGLEVAKADLLSDKQPSLQFATPEQIGTVAVFLCSEAAAQIRGAALPVDGGWTAVDLAREPRSICRQFRSINQFA
jgi:NAD(P)-dependent dehydrogenase (short-subunit alcohol dehydrogenase family)